MPHEPSELDRTSDAVGTPKILDIIKAQSDRIDQLKPEILLLQKHAEELVEEHYSHLQGDAKDKKRQDILKKFVDIHLRGSTKYHTGNDEAREEEDEAEKRQFQQGKKGESSGAGKGKSK
ncbi:MAG: hypothetical protein Q9223_006157 [Gallowayella weberi]